MKTIYINCFLLMLVSLAAHAEVFKCQSADGKTKYQTMPCVASASVQQVLKVKPMSPEETDAAKARLNTWQAQQNAEEAAKIQAQKDRQLARERQESLELQRRSVIAQEQQAATQQQNQYRPGGSPLYYPAPCSNSPWANYDWEHHYRPDCRPVYPYPNPMPPVNRVPSHQNQSWPPPQLTLPSNQPPWPLPKPWPGRAMGQ